MRAIQALLALACTPYVAVAAEVTDVPPALRGDVHLDYTGSYEQVGLEEGTDTYGIRNTTRHDLGIRLEFSPYRGIIATIGLPITIQQQITFPAARQMLYEPITGEGSFTNGQPIEVDPLVSGGLQGAWFGAAFVPFSEDYDRSLPVTARFDLAVRTGGRNQTLYSASRGAAPGGPALRIAGAFSTRQGIANPYLTIDYINELASDVGEVVDRDGNVWATDLSLKPGSRLDVIGGAELVAFEREETRSRLAIDLHLGIAYRSWEDRASGFWLPDVLEPSRSIAVTRGDYVVVRGGAGIDYHLNRWMGLRLGAEGRYFTPHTIESAYRVRTDGQSFQVAWNLGIVGRVRLKGDP